VLDRLKAASLTDLANALTTFKGVFVFVGACAELSIRHGGGTGNSQSIALRL